MIIVGENTTSTGLTVGYEEEMHISSGGVASDTIVNSDGWMNISSGGVANNTTLKDGGMFISSGGVANDTIVNSDGWMYISSGGVANDTTVNSGGSMDIDIGGVANSTTVTDWGSMSISSGGVANNTTVNEYGYLSISSGGVANNTTVNPWGNMYIESGGVANSTTVNWGGNMHISRGGVASDTTVNSGYMYITSGGVANSTTVNPWGDLYISSGGVANSTTVNKWGTLDISSGGTATNITAKKGAVLGLTVAPDTYIQGTSNGSAFEMKDATINNYTMNNWGYMYISSGGVANSTTVDSWGGMYIESGGVANSTTVNDWGHMCICSGGVANNTTFYCKKRNIQGYPTLMSVDGGGSANNTEINSGCGMIVSHNWYDGGDGGSATNTIIKSGGAMYVGCDEYGYDEYGYGAYADCIVLHSGAELYVASGGTATNIIGTPFGRGSVYASEGAVVSYADESLSFGVFFGSKNKLISHSFQQNEKKITAGGQMYVYQNGEAQNITVLKNGQLIVSEGVVRAATIKTGGSMYVSDGKITGGLLLSDGARVEVAGETTIDFDVAGRNWKDDAMYNDLSGIEFADSAQVSYTVTVGENTYGNYKLAENSRSFYADYGNDYGETITLNDKYELTIGSEESSQFIEDGAWYRLYRDENNTLMLDVESDDAKNGISFHEGDCIDSLNVAATGSLGRNANYTDEFQWKQDTAGKFTLSGDFGNLNGSIVIKNEKNKTVANGTIRNGVLTFNGNKSVLLDKGSYSISLKNTDKGKTATEYSFVIGAEILYDKGDNSDDWTDVKTAGADGAVAKTIGNLTAETEIENWVGFGDAVDYHEFTLTDDAKLNLNISSTDAAKVVIYKLNEKTNTRTGVTTYSLKTLQTTTIAAGYTLTTKDLLLENGTYYIGVTSTNAKRGGNADYTITVDESSKFFSKVDNSDDWTDVKTAGADGAVGKIDGDFKIGTTVSDWVGYGDATDYRSFTITEDMTVSFDVKSSDAAKFNLYTLNENKNGTFRLKSLLSASVSAGQTVPTKSITLAAGTYYIGMTSTNAKKGGDADYTITVKDPNATVTPVIDNADDWTDLKTEGVAGEVAKLGTLDENIKKTGWVGTDDAVDYMTFTLNDSASLSFDVSATDAAKFVVYELKESYNKKTGVTTFSLKALQTTTIKAGYTIPTKNLLLESGKTYAIGMTSTNARKGGSAEYSFVLNDNTTFFTRADNSDDVFTDAEQINITSGVADGWVGYSDSVDYMEFTLDTAAKLNFDVASSDSAKFVIYQLNDKTGKLKALQTTTIKANTVTPTKDLFLAAGTYYISVTSTNAKKGGNADYSFSLNDSSVFYLEAGDNSDDTWKLVQEDDAAALDGANINGWVGYSDAADFVKLELDGSGAISLELDEVTATAYERKELKITCVDEKGKAIALTYDAATESLTSKLTFTEGTVCYVGVSTTNQKKYDTEYQITAGILA